MSLQIELAARTRQAVLLMIRNAQDAQKALERQGPLTALAEQMGWEMFLKEYCTVHVAGPRRSGHTSAIAALREELEHDHKASTVATTPVAAVQARRRDGDEHWPVFTPIRKLYQVPVADVIFVDNAFHLAAGTQSHVHAFAQECVKILGRVVIVLVQ